MRRHKNQYWRKRREKREETKKMLKKRQETVEELLNNYNLKGYVEYIKKEILSENVPLWLKIRDIQHLSKINDDSILEFLNNYNKNIDKLNLNEEEKRRLKYEVEAAINEIKRNLNLY